MLVIVSQCRINLGKRKMRMLPTQLPCIPIISRMLTNELQNRKAPGLNCRASPVV